MIAWLDQGRPSLASSRGWRCFQLGLFLLPSSALLGSLLLFPALLFGCAGRDRPYWRDPWNAPLLAAAGLMILGCFGAYEQGLAWVGLGNWLPFFWGFWGFQPYVMSAEARRRSALWLVAGSVPVVVTGLGQIWWGWQGPWQLLGGLIVWFMAAGGRPEGRLSGLFDYANIASAWLALVWPLTLAALVQQGLNRWRRVVVVVLAVLVVVALVLTESRNGWGSLVLVVPLVLGPPSWPWLIPLLALALLPVLLSVLPGIPLPLQDPARTLVPESLWARLNDSQYGGERVLASTRISQWNVAAQLIVERPWLGWGAAAFSVIYPLRTGQWHGHAHNLPLELSISHGLPVAVLLVGFVLALLVVSLRRGLSGLFDRAWWTALFVLMVLHGTDLPFFDSRLNIVGWILLAGLRASFSPELSVRLHSETGSGA